MFKASRNIRKMVSLIKKQEAVSEVIELQELGWTQRRIAEYLGRNVSWVNKVLKNNKELQLSEPQSVMPTAESEAEDRWISELYGGNK